MKFLCLTHLDRGLRPPAVLTDQYAELESALRHAGAFVDSGRVAGPEDSKTVRLHEGGATVTDESPTATGSVPSAYFVLECRDLSEALRWVAKIPAATYGSVEVRPPR